MTKLLAKLTAGGRTGLDAAIDVAGAWLPLLVALLALVVASSPALHHLAGAHVPDLGWWAARASHYDPNRDPRVRVAGAGTLALTFALAVAGRALGRP